MMSRGERLRLAYEAKRQKTTDGSRVPKEPPADSPEPASAPPRGRSSDMMSRAELIRLMHELKRQKTTDGSRVPKEPPADSAEPASAPPRGRSSDMMSRTELLRLMHEAKRQKTTDGSRVPKVERQVQPSHTVPSSLPPRVVTPQGPNLAPSPPTRPPTSSEGGGTRDMLREVYALLEGSITTIDGRLEAATRRAKEALKALEAEKKTAEVALKALGAEKKAAEEARKARCDAQAELEAERKKHADELARSITTYKEEARKARRDAQADLEAERKKHADELARSITTYKESEGFTWDAEAYAQEHLNGLVASWLVTDAGQDMLAEDGLLSFQVGRYEMQGDIYSVLRQRYGAFNPTAWGLPAELEDPEARKRSPSSLLEGNQLNTDPLPLSSLERIKEGLPIPHPGEVSPSLENLHFPETMGEPDERTMAAPATTELNSATLDLNE
ncbi:PREDICTED: tubby-related protein 1-like isoform X2 [Ipomoea nil]|nr:PREDICTED: tubby-related protein 1-like isoform X2 [Ipomoea nil]XP_019169446.1 PREDICTED: tubby-related protein 1-like isoform X2 [Ipomoea nil]